MILEGEKPFGNLIVLSGGKEDYKFDDCYSMIILSTELNWDLAEQWAVRKVSRGAPDRNRTGE